MLQLVGQLLALAYLSRLYAPPQGAAPLGWATALYIGLFVVVGLVGTLALPAAALGLSRRLVVEELQVWRPLTAVFWADGLGLGFALQLWFFGIYSSLLERRYYGSAPVRYMATLLGGTVLIALQALMLDGEPLALSNALCLFVVTLWSRAEPLKPVQLLQMVSTSHAHVPWYLTAVALPLTGVHATFCNLFGISAALLIEAVVGLPSAGGGGGGKAQPAGGRNSGSSGRSSGGQASSAAAGGSSGGGVSGGGGKGAGRHGGKGASKAAQAKAGSSPQRERAVRWAQVGLCFALVAYHAAARVSEHRAERSVEMQLARQLNAAIGAPAAADGDAGSGRP